MDYTNLVPPYDSQYSALTHTDAQDCTAESLCHNYYIMTGVRVSPRALAVMAHLEDANNRNVTNVLATANKYGLVPWNFCPTPDSFTMESYYAPLTETENQPFPVDISLVPFDLNVSPGWTELEWGYDSPGVVATRHLVAQINSTQYFDSEQGAPIKPLNYEGARVVWQSSLKIERSNMDDGFFLAADGKTFVYYHKVGSASELVGLGKLVKVPVPLNTDGSPNFSALPLTPVAEI